MKRKFFVVLPILIILTFGAALAAAVIPGEIEQSGTQPGEVSNLEAPGRCDNCHGGYNHGGRDGF